MRNTLFVTAAAAALAFSVAACGNKDSASVQAGSASGTANATEAAQAKGSDIVDKTQDAAAAAVGQLSAVTAGSLSAQAFVENAARSDMYETESSKLALDRSKSAKIKDFARMMISMHAKTTAELKAIVAGGKAGENVQLPVAMDERRKGLVDNLKSASADDFDARYVDQQTAAHAEARTLMGGYGNAGQNEALKAFAKATEPKIAAHENVVKGLDRSNADKDAPAKSD